MSTDFKNDIKNARTTSPDHFLSHYLADRWNFIPVFLRGCLHATFHPGMKIVSGRNHPCLWWNFSYCLHVFAEMKFPPEMSSSLSKRQGWTFTPVRKKKKRRVNTKSRDEILIWACFFLIFDVYIQICFPKLTCLNIMKVWI